MKTITVSDALNTMTRDQLRHVARQLDVRRGRNRNDTVANLADAFANGTGRFTFEIRIRETGVPGSSYSPVIFQQKTRTHKPNKVSIPGLQVPA